MKKVILAVLLISVPLAGSAPVFGAEFSLSAGGGALLGYTFSRYTLSEGNVESKQKMDRFNYSGFLFFDATYVEFAVSILGGVNSYTESMTIETSTNPEKGKGSELNLGFSLLGKYPFTINEKLTWFPMLGVEYNIALVQKRTPKGGGTYKRQNPQGYATDVDKDGNSYPISAWNAFWIDVGAGMDYKLTDHLFLRGEILFNFRLPTGYELGALEVAKKSLGLDDPKLRGLTGGPNFKIALGYKF